MEQNLEIKAVLIADHYEEIAEMMAGLHENERGLHDKTARWADIREGYMRHVMEMQQECEGHCLVAYIDGKAVGFIFGYLEDQDDSRIEVYEGKELYVSDGYIVAEHRREGIYHKLNDRLEQHFTEKGVGRITRFTLVNNTGMRQLLEKKGYTITRLLYEKWL